MQPLETGCKAPAVEHLAGSGMTGEDRSASNLAESPPPTAPMYHQHPPELHQNPPFSAMAGSRQHRGVPGSCAGRRARVAMFKRSCWLSEIDGEGIIMYLYY